MKTRKFRLEKTDFYIAIYEEPRTSMLALQQTRESALAYIKAYVKRTAKEKGAAYEIVESKSD